MHKMKKASLFLLAAAMILSLPLQASAANVDDATIDLSRSGSVDIYKYDLTSAEKDGIWDSSYVSTGVRDEEGVETILGSSERISSLNANGEAYGYAIKGVEFSYIMYQRDRHNSLQRKNKACWCGALLDCVS